MGHLNERKTSFNLAEEEGLETKMTDFDSHQGHTIRREAVGQAVSSVPSRSCHVQLLHSAITKQRYKRQTKHNSVSLSLLGAFSLPRRVEMLTHIRKLNLLLRPKQFWIKVFKNGFKCNFEKG